MLTGGEQLSVTTGESSCEEPGVSPPETEGRDTPGPPLQAEWSGCPPQSRLHAANLGVGHLSVLFTLESVAGPSGRRRNWNKKSREY